MFGARVYPSSEDGKIIICQTESVPDTFRHSVNLASTRIVDASDPKAIGELVLKAIAGPRQEPKKKN